MNILSTRGQISGKIIWDSLSPINKQHIRDNNDEGFINWLMEQKFDNNLHFMKTAVPSDQFIRHKLELLKK